MNPRRYSPRARRWLRLGVVRDQAGGERWSYFDTGPADRGGQSSPAVLLIHGFTADKGTWLSMAGALAGRYRVIALDLAGHGKSSEAADGDYRLAAQARRAHRVAEALGLEHYHVLGHSMGGAVAIVVAGTHPQAVLSLGLVSTAGLPDPHTEEFVRKLSEDEVNPLIVSGKWSLADKITYVSTGPKQLHRLFRFLSPFMTRFKERRAPLYSQIFEQLSNDPLSQDDLRRVVQPTFLLWGDADRVLEPNRARDYASAITGPCTLETLHGIGHLPSIEAPGESARKYLAFLDR